MRAMGTFLLLMGSTLNVFAGLAFECNDSVSTDKNEINAIIAESISAFGYFYIPVGVMYLSKDMGIGSINENIIKKSQIIFVCIIGLISVLFVVLLPFFKILSIVGITFNFLYSTIWIFTIYRYNGLYHEILKAMNRCWLFIYIGIIAGFVSELFHVIYLLISEAEYLVIFCQLLLAASFIIGFFKLAKMIDAI